MDVAKDCTFVAGLAAVAYGVWSIYPPAAWIFAGLSASTVAYLTSDRTPTDK